jgi:hypothetical protein
MMNMGKTLIPCAWMFVIVHVQDIHDHPTDDLSLAIIFGVKVYGFGDLGVQS